MALKQRYFLLGGTGNTGRRIAKLLADKGHEVRALTRKPEQAPRLKGVEWVKGEVANSELLIQEFREATAAYLMLPNDPAAENYLALHNQRAEHIAQAAGNATLSHAVVLSSQGADRPSGTGPIQCLYTLEQALAQHRHLNLQILRPAYFMENLMGQIPSIAQYQVMGGGFAPETTFSMIATADIAAVAAHHLDQLDFSGRQVQDLLGGGAYSQQQTAAILGAAIGQPDLPYVQLPEEQMRGILLSVGMSASLAELYPEMFRTNMDFVAESTPQNTTPTTLEQWAREVFAPAFRAGQSPT